MTTLKRIDPVSCGMLMGVVLAVVGLFAGGLFFLLSLFGLLQEGGAFAMLFGLGAIVVMPILYGVFGFLQGLIGAFIYNLAAGAMGGIKIELAQEEAAGAVQYRST
jgi:hypothetical protein